MLCCLESFQMSYSVPHFAVMWVCTFKMLCRDPETYNFPVCTHLSMVADAELQKVSWIHGCLLSLSTSHIEHRIFDKKKKKTENKIHKITCSFVMGRWFHFSCFEAKKSISFSSTACFICLLHHTI